jgi:hypothetical protein
MNYDEALKKVQAAKQRDNFMLIALDYETKLLLPYKDALTLLSALANAEILKEGYKEPHHIKPFDRSKMEIRLMSHVEYIRFKIAALLNIDAKDVQEQELLAM